MVTVPPLGIQAIDAVPSLLHQRFRQYLSELPEWEQMMILAVLRRVVEMMGAQPSSNSPQVSDGPRPGEPTGPHDPSLATPAA